MLNPSIETTVSAKKKFNIIGIAGRPRNDKNLQMHKNLIAWLKERNYQIIVETEIGQELNLPQHCLVSLDEMGHKAELAIVIGGDGNMLGKARILSKYDTALIGINRGNLGFLTDIDPNRTYEQLHACLEKGEYFIEERFLLDVNIVRNGEVICTNQAINEVVIHQNKIASMIDFQVYINDKFTFSQRSDGLIIATPTGSTAYSLSAGGPILTPQLNALTLVPMFPHTLSSRPLVIDGDSKVSFRFADYNVEQLEVSCDSQINIPFSCDDVIIVRKSKQKMRLLHPTDYSYFNVLSSKLGWLKKLF